MLCVGLDPDPARLPAPLAGTRDATERFCREIIDATADLACAFKPQIAYFASQRAEPALEKICSYVRERYPDVTLILDAQGTLVLEYRSSTGASGHPQDVLEDCQALFGN